MAQTPTIPEIKKRTRRRGRLLMIEAVVGLLVLIGFIAAALYFTGAGFREKVRRAVVTQLEDATGGKVEIQSFQWNLAKLAVEIDGLTIHGREAANEAPYLHVDHLSLRAKVLAVLEHKVGLRYVGITRPLVHIIVYPDGSTNQPTPRAHGHGRDAVQSVFDLAINRADVNDGVLLLNDRKLPFALHASELQVTLTKPHHTRTEYDLHLQAKGIELQQPGMQAIQAG
ncbi:MAG TPA: hypothetical protein VGC88_06235, partial [Terriglobales bacterium]